MRRNPNPALIGPAERAEVVALALKVGAAETSKRTGHKAATIRQWVKRAHEPVPDVRSALVADLVPDLAQPASVTEVEQPTRVVAAEPDPRSWREQRPDAVKRLATMVHRAIDAAERAIEANDGRRAKDFTTVAAIAIDKAQLLTGAATNRTETESRTLTMRIDASPEEVRAEVERLRAELGVPRPPAIEATSTETTSSEEGGR